MIDRNAVEWNEMQIKLRHGETNTKLDRSPYNIEQAAYALAMEAGDLNGTDSVHRIVLRALDVLHGETDRTVVTQPCDIIEAGVWAMLHQEGVTPEQAATMIVSELARRFPNGNLGNALEVARDVMRDEVPAPTA